MNKLFLISSILLPMLMACGQQPWQVGNVQVLNLLSAHTATVNVYIDGSKQKTLTFVPDGRDTVGYGPQLGQRVCITMESDAARAAYTFRVQKPYPHTDTVQVIEREGQVELRAGPEATPVSTCP